MPLTFGIFDHMERQHAIPLDQQFRERLDLVALADRLGFWGYHLAEHHFTPLSVAPSQSVFLAAAAQRTGRIQLIPLVYCLPFYHPLRLIEEVAMLDNLCGGRLQVGVGRGCGLGDPQRQLLHAEGTPMVRSGAQTSQRVDMRGGTVAGVPVPVKPRIACGESSHQAVANHLGDDRSTGHGVALPVTPHHRRMHHA